MFSTRLNIYRCRQNRPTLLHVGILLVWFLLLAWPSSIRAADFLLEPRDSSSPILNDSGYYTLRWESRTSVEIEQSETKDFSSANTIYAGPDNARFISGLADGTYYFRIRGEDGSWSDALVLQVQHPSLILAIFLCTLGALVFISTAALVIHGAGKPELDLE